MAEKKYVRIPAKDLPDVFYIPDNVNAPEDGGKNVYFARYRVMSEDGTVFSRWSQKFEVPTGVLGSDISILQDTSLWKATNSGGILTVTWNVSDLFTEKKIFVNKFHVYIRIYDNSDPGNWVFAEEAVSASFTSLVPTNKKVDVAVLIPTNRGIDATTASPDSPITLYPESVLFYKLDV